MLTRLKSHSRKQKNDKDEDFTTDHADTYKAVYYVEPVNQGASEVSDQPKADCA